MTECFLTESFDVSLWFGGNMKVWLFSKISPEEQQSWTFSNLLLEKYVNMIFTIIAFEKCDVLKLYSN